MREFGIIGFPLTHSFSASYFNKKFERENINALFTAFELEDIHDFPQLLKANTGICGLSVTIPHKQTVIPFLDETDKAAAAIGAVNCISFRNGTSRGHNTDIYGFAESLRPLIMPHHTQALVQRRCAMFWRSGVCPSFRCRERTASTCFLMPN
jgi:shikimate dehydrogenase